MFQKITDDIVFRFSSLSLFIFFFALYHLKNISSLNRTLVPMFFLYFQNLIFSWQSNVNNFLEYFCTEFSAGNTYYLVHMLEYYAEDLTENLKRGLVSKTMGYEVGIITKN